MLPSTLTTVTLTNVTTSGTRVNWTGSGYTKVIVTWTGGGSSGYILSATQCLYPAGYHTGSGFTVSSTNTTGSGNFTKGFLDAVGLNNAQGYGLGGFGGGGGGGNSGGSKTAGGGAGWISSQGGQSGSAAVSPATNYVNTTFNDAKGHALGFRMVKILDIGYITVIYFILALCIGIPIDRMLGKFNPVAYDKKSSLIIILELILHVYILGIVMYSVRNLVELLPSPLNGLYGYDHMRLKEMQNAAIFGLIIIWNQQYLIKKMLYLHDRYTLR
eukprot:gene28816-32005_t